MCTLSSLSSSSNFSNFPMASSSIPLKKSGLSLYAVPAKAVMIFLEILSTRDRGNFAETSKHNRIHFNEFVDAQLREFRESLIINKFTNGLIANLNATMYAAQIMAIRDELSNPEIRSLALNYQERWINWARLIAKIFKENIKDSAFVHLTDNEGFILIVVKQNGLLLEHASDRLKSDPIIVKEAVNQHPWAFKYASEILKNDEKILTIALNKDGSALRWASETLRNTPFIVRIAVTQDGRALKFASDLIRGNPFIVECAVQRHGDALRYALDVLKNNILIVKAAVTKSGWALRFASKELRDNPAIVRLAVTQNGKALKYASKRLQNDLDMIKIAFAQK